MNESRQVEAPQPPQMASSALRSSLTENLAIGTFFGLTNECFKGCNDEC